VAYPNILVIDGEDNFLSLVMRVLGKEGYQVYATRDGQDGLRRHDQKPFDLVIVDTHLHPLDGLSIIDHVKNRNQSTEVIVLTAFPTEETRSLAFIKGAKAYLSKPISIEELKTTVRQNLSPF